MSDPRYVYAIVRSDAALPATDAPSAVSELSIVSWRELAAVTRSTAGKRPPLTMTAVLQHEVVIEAVRQMGPALPVRFGTVFSSAESIASALAETYDRLAADLVRLGDKAELSLTALWATMPAGDSHSDAASAKEGTPAGARYLQAKAAELRRDDALEAKARSYARRLDEFMGKLAIEQRVSLLPSPRIAIRAAYLINPTRVFAVRAAFDEMREDVSELRMLLTGPWPPYSFVARPDIEEFAMQDPRVADRAQSQQLSNQE